MQGLAASFSQPRRWVARAVFALGMLLAFAAQASTPLHGAWREVRNGDTPAQVMRDFHLGRLTAFDPGTLQRFPTGKQGSWVVLQPQPPWVNEERVLTMYPPILGSVTLYDRNNAVSRMAMDDFSRVMHGHGRLAFRLNLQQTASSAILLRLQPTAFIAGPVGFRLQQRDDYVRSDALWIAFVSAGLAVMLAMALMALCFATMLRDMTFVWYAGYMVSYALIQSVQTGFLLHPLELAWAARHVAALDWMGQVLSVAFGALFVVRFCDLRTHARSIRLAILLFGGLVLLLMLMRVSSVPLLVTLDQRLINPLMIMGAAAMLLGGVVATVRGSRYGWYFLLGWLPLLVITALNSAQNAGALAQWDWLNNGSLVAATFEALVLSIGLADRALILRRDAQKIRLLADKDALTEALNRRAWGEAASAALAATPVQPVAVLFLDLDHFKLLNDRRGHAAGDEALIAVAATLRAELRPGDLLGRYGGEEFVALLKGTKEEEAMQVATRLCRRVHRLELKVDHDLMLLTVSIGVSIRQPGDTLDALVQRADEAMYQAKLTGRNRVRLSEPVRRTADVLSMDRSVGA